jgi:hypothetical protein
MSDVERLLSGIGDRLLLAESRPLDSLNGKSGKDLFF